MRGSERFGTPSARLFLYCLACAATRPAQPIRAARVEGSISMRRQNMHWKIARHLPTHRDFLEMLERARAVTAEALAQAERTGNRFLFLKCQSELSNWDTLIERTRAVPLKRRKPAVNSNNGGEARQGSDYQDRRGSASAAFRDRSQSRGGTRDAPDCPRDGSKRDRSRAVIREPAAQNAE